MRETADDNGCWLYFAHTLNTVFSPFKAVSVLISAYLDFSNFGGRAGGFCKAYRDASHISVAMSRSLSLELGEVLTDLGLIR